MKKIFYLLFCIICFQSVNAQLLINEYSAANYDSYLDNYSEEQDWIEIYNSTASPIDINGYFITDKVSNPTKWQVPSSFIIPANDVGIIFCSGRDEVSGGFAHTNFKITQTKGDEVLMISDASQVLLDSISVRSNLKSHSMGRETNGSFTWAVFDNATPATTNVGSFERYAYTPVFSLPSGYYSGSAQVIITSPDPNVIIYYTTDGSKPDNTSLQYTTPITFLQTTVLKAVAYSSNPNILPSFIDYNTYFIDDTHTIPILSISGDGIDDLMVSIPSGGTASPASRPEGTIEYFDENGILIDKGSGEYNKHGNDSWNWYDQRGIDYIMRDQFGYNYALKDKIFATKDRNKFQRLIIKAAANDNYPASNGGAHIRDSYVHHLSQLAELKLDERSYAPCALYKNGEYWGLYDIREKVDDTDFLDYYYDQDEKHKDSPEYIQYLKLWGAISTEYGDPNAETDWLALKNYITSNSMANNANYQTVKDQFNTGSIIDYFLLNSYVVAADWLNYNTGWWRGLDPNGDKKKWRYELWDMDNTFDHGINWTGIPNQGANADPCDPDNLPDPGGQWSQVPIWNALQDNPDFFDDYLNRWQDLANGYFSCDSMIAVLDRMIDVIDPEMDKQIQKWGGNKPEWLSNVDLLRDFINQRCVFMNTGFVPCYQPTISGPYNVTVEIIGFGEVEMSNGNFINQNNTGWTDQRFGGITLPFEVISGTFQSWDVIPAGIYPFDPLVDTLELDLQGDVTVIANFIPPTPTRDIVYKVEPAGTTTSIDINGVNMSIFPATLNYTIGDTVSIIPQIDPLWGFSYWETDSVIMMPLNTNPTDSFYVDYYDTVVLHIYEIPTIKAFISGNDTICDNEEDPAEVSVSFSGANPFTFVYKHNGIEQDPIPTDLNPYIIKTKEQGSYKLVSFSDVSGEIGWISGSALVTVLPSPNAAFHLTDSDTLNILDATTEFIDDSEGNIVSWEWNFGDNTAYDYTELPIHTFPQISSVYTVSLVVTDENSCKNAISRNITIQDLHWIYIPNSFTPDFDQINDKFCISYNGIREETFNFIIYDKVSTVVFSTTNIYDLDCNNGWDGKHQTTGEDLPMGMYVYEIYFQDFEGWKHQDFGNIFIIR